MDIIEIMKILSRCKRVVLQDLSFKEKEIRWYLGDKLVAEAYVGDKHTFSFNHDGLKYENELPGIVNKLIDLGNRHVIRYNDK